MVEVGISSLVTAVVIDSGSPRNRGVKKKPEIEVKKASINGCGLPVER